MKKMRVTVNGTAYDVEVELLEDHEEGRGYGYHSSEVHPGNGVPATGLPPAHAEIDRGIKRPPSTDKKELTSPIAGMVTEIKVKPGDKVAENDSLMIIEAMKMNTHISSPVSGIIERINVQAKEGVTQGQVLLKFK